MFELVLVICLAVRPDHCAIERPLSFERYPTAIECTHNSYAHVVHWLMEHPNWNVRQWRCEQPGA
ncbi:hypothetical protein GAY33_18740 [Azospirillum brasilense]|uniref:Uncharacterized protein n=1 Tax=Azospirillum argentinense TaxID=2970906 RepID=A0A5B0L1T9_9PROT|nr:hypothetical protein [Azospirillum argentinense]KAA1057760.1 hypothetical protein FH063_001928 [Azospirillum argentinense]MBK3801235.1 hypothetical protein [Azospirillum argentinense]